MYLINKKQEHLYRPNVGCVLMKNNNIFIGKRLGYNVDSWQMPQGGINENENYEDALIRELCEEIGTSNIEILKKSTYNRYYKISQDAAQNAWGGKYIGQKQIWFLANFKGEDDEINIATEIPEFEDWMWSSPSDVIKKTIFFKKDIYIDVFGEFELY